MEGPSDRIYLNRWIELVSDGAFTEGRHYQCAFFGGSLLANVQAAQPEDEFRELVNLLRINARVCVVCDSDRKANTDELKTRVVRIKNEVELIPDAVVWVTQAKEIENYIPGEVLASATGGEALPDPEKFEIFFPSDCGGPSYHLDKLKRKSAIDKMSLAEKCIQYFTLENMSPRFDWKESIDRIVAAIRSWNS